MADSDPCPALGEKEWKEMDRAMLEDNLNDGYFKRACAAALIEQVRRQGKTGELL